MIACMCLCALEGEGYKWRRFVQLDMKSSNRRAIFRYTDVHQILKNNKEW